MKLALERHAYAPELNKAHVLRNGRTVAVLPCPGATSIRDARKALFAPALPCRLVDLSTERDSPWSGYNRTYKAAYPLAPGTLAKIVADARTLHDSGGKLLDGRTMPPTRQRLVTRLAWRTAS